MECGLLRREKQWGKFYGKERQTVWRRVVFRGVVDQILLFVFGMSEMFMFVTI